MTTMEAMQAGSPFYENMPTDLLKTDLAELEEFFASAERRNVAIMHPSPYHVRRGERAEVVFRQIEVEAFGSESVHEGYQAPWKYSTKAP